MSKLPEMVSISILTLVLGLSSTTSAFAESGRPPGDFAEVKHIVTNHLEASHGGESTEEGHLIGLRYKNATESSKLTNRKQQFCLNHQQEITTRLDHLVTLSQKLQNTFDKITTKIENFYTVKVIPSGKMVSNYDALVADITAKKAAVQAAIDQAQSDKSSFSCTQPNPAISLKSFDQDMKNVRNALLAYKTSVKNLNVAVKSVNDLENRANESSASGKLRFKNASESAFESTESSQVSNK